LKTDAGWGTRSLRLSLPALELQLSGLSAAQRTALAASYPDFVDVTADSPCEENVECRAYPLAQAPDLPLSALSRDGQYAPRKTRLPGGAGIALTGADFEARFGLEPPLAFAELGVFEEGKLAGELVIQNFLRILVAHQALRRGGAVLHSAGLVFEGQAYVFPGYSNAGKTTLARKAHARGARVLSDDINLVLPNEGGYEAHAVPFTGEFGRTFDRREGKASYPLAGIVLLEQGDRLETTVPNPAVAVARLLACCPFVNTDEEESAILFEILTALAAQVPVISLRCRRDDAIDSLMAAVKRRIETTRAVEERQGG
jgi:hypothetical protein